MEGKMKYYQLTFTLDEKIRGRYDMPHTIEIESRDYLKYISDRANPISAYFENRKDLYADMPDDLCGKILERKDVIDFMDFTPACISLVAIVSNKIKRIFEKLNVSKDEYVFRRISIKGHAEDFYLLFLPIIPDTDFVYPKCIFEDMFDDGVVKTFNSRTEYYQDPNYYYLKKVTLSGDYKDYDLLYPQGGGFFFSERVVEAMQQENIVGYDIIKGGCFYQDIDFD